MKTKAQIRTPQKTYGRQTARGNTGEAKAAKILRELGYTVSKSPTHPRGFADIHATKNGETRKIQVKHITSRTFQSADAARNRMRGKPYLISRIPSGCELWVFDAGGHLWKFP